MAAADRPHPDHGPKHPDRHSRPGLVLRAGRAGSLRRVHSCATRRRNALQLLAVVQAVLLTGFAAQTILGNGAWLHLAPVRRASGAAVGAVSLAVLLGVYWSLTSAVRPGGVAASPASTILGWSVAAVGIVVPLVMLTACSVYVAGGRPYLTDYAPVHNIGQDLLPPHAPVVRPRLGAQF